MRLRTKRIIWALALFLLAGLLWRPWAANRETPPLPSEPPSSTPPPPPAEPLTLAAVGDVMLARKVDRLMQSQGLGYPLAELGPLLRSADLTFGNLESPLSDTGKPIPGKGIWFRARPEALQVLQQGGFDILNIANNHILDYDTPAFLQTMELLDKAGIRYFGGGQNIQEARRPVLLEEKGIRLGFLGYSDMADIFWSYDYPRSFKATADRPGIAPLEIEAMCQDVELLKAQTDIAVVSLHWGTEYQRRPSSEQRQIAHRLVEAGADIILGHHPHVFQGIEVYKGSIILYSLGNFIMDQNWSRETCEGLLVMLTLTQAGWQQAEILPVQIVEEQPQRATGTRAGKILAELRDLSRDLDTAVEISGNRAIVHQQP
ncbi:CapA family protein [Thermanaeromonas sp. C210]|uniref:CapA family protein n=1 Tax=Thermanaeromonas sp. C210 TaxID=2731925 RepID=UPI001566864F|nr:CapA family protein [Thermanaeromonas sp. C210]